MLCLCLARIVELGGGGTVDSEGRLPGGKDIGAQSSTLGGFTAGGKGHLRSDDGACKLWLAM